MHKRKYINIYNPHRYKGLCKQDHCRGIYLLPSITGEEISFRDIHTFSISTKIQDGCQKWQKSKFYPFAQDILVLPCGSKIHSKSLYLYGFRDIHTFSFSTQIQDGRQKWRKSKFYTFLLDTLVLPCGSKIRSKSLYLLWFARYL